MVLQIGKDDAKRSSVEFADLLADDKSAKSLGEELMNRKLQLNHLIQ